MKSREQRAAFKVPDFFRRNQTQTDKTEQKQPQARSSADFLPSSPEFIPKTQTRALTSDSEEKTLTKSVQENGKSISVTVRKGTNNRGKQCKKLKINVDLTTMMWQIIKIHHEDGGRYHDLHFQLHLQKCAVNTHPALIRDLCCP